MINKRLAMAALLVTSAAFFSQQSVAVSVDLDLTSPDSIGSTYWGYSAAYNYDELGLTVTGFTEKYSIQPQWMGNYSGGLGVEVAWSPEHSIDNNEWYYGKYAFDMLLLSFDQAVSLDGITAGWRGKDYYERSTDAGNSEASILAYTGEDFAGTFVESSWNDLGSDWTGIGNYQIDDLNSPEAVNETGLLSKYWLVGAYNHTLNNMPSEAGVNFSAGNDFWKLKEVSVSVNPVPLPGSLVLFGTALLAVGSIRRKVKK